MVQTVVVTDLTQMPKGNRVCIVGINEANQCIRPVTPNREEGVPKAYLRSGNEVVVRPRAGVRLDLHEVAVQPPHIEDRGFEPDSILASGLCDDAEWENVLLSSSFGTLDSIFDGFLQGGAWVPPGAKTRSVGTLSPIAAARVELAEYGGKLKYRLTFEDSSGSSFTRPVSDLAFRELCYAEIRRHTRSCKDVAQELSGLLEGATRIYLRLGLARPWLNPKLGQAGCYLQVTGIHTFPDYLQGKSFADFQS